MATNNKGRNGGNRATLKTANKSQYLTSQAPTCIRCERHGQRITVAWGYHVKGNPKALLFPVCSQCGLALDNSEQARQKLALKIEGLFPDYIATEDGAVIVHLYGVSPSGNNGGGSAA